MEIHVDDVPELRQEFERVPRPRSIPAELLTAPLEILEDKLHGVKLGWVRRQIRKLSDAAAVKNAAWRWLKPGDDMATQEHLVDLQRKVDLVHLDHRDFCARLIDACRELVGDRSPLARHVDARVAEIEYRLHVPMPRDNEAARGFERLQALLLSAQARGSAPLARKTCQLALSQVGALVKYAIVGQTRETCSFDANLMVPASGLDGVWGRGASHASRVWQDFGDEAEQYLVVVEEAPADPESYRGFWIPDVRPANTPLPGAPRALYYSAPQAVFVDHLPKLPVSDEALHGRWREYFRGSLAGFNGRLFVSLPVVDAGEGVAVVNINVRDQGSWSRALSPSWLSRAMRLAAPWTATAWHAFMVAWMFESANDTKVKRFTPRKVAAFVPAGQNGGESAKKLPPRGGSDE